MRSRRARRGRRGGTRSGTGRFDSLENESGRRFFRGTGGRGEWGGWADQPRSVADGVAGRLIGAGGGGGGWGGARAGRGGGCGGSRGVGGGVGGGVGVRRGGGARR